MPITCPIDLKPLSTEVFGRLDYAVMGHAFASHRELGRLADEVVYQGDLAMRLSDADMLVSRELPVTVSFRSFSKTYLIDLLVDAKAIYELKAVAKLKEAHVAQLLNYLLLLDAERGKLVNFRSTSVESKFVNAPTSRRQRQQFAVDDTRWQGDESFRDKLIELLRDWGTGLELSLYRETLVHVLGGEERVSVLLPLQREGVALGNQRFNLADDNSAFRLTAFSKDAKAYESQLKSLLRHSPLKFIHWVNIDLEHVVFTTVDRS